MTTNSSLHIAKKLDTGSRPDQDATGGNHPRGRPNTSGKKYPFYFPGGKNHKGVLPKLINLIPKHTTMIECYAGSAPLTRNLKRCERTFVVEINPAFCARYNFKNDPGVTILNEDAINVLRSFKYFESDKAKDVFVYADPPHVKSTRRSKKKIFKYDYENFDHERLCHLLVTLPFNIAISSYRNPLYDDILKGWNRFDYSAHTNTGKVTECVYYNYPLDGKLHDYRFVGNTTKRRKEIRGYGATMIRKLKSLAPEERNGILVRIAEAFPSQLNLSDI